MPLDEELDEQEMRILLCNKAIIIANCVTSPPGTEGRLSNERIVQITERMAEIANSLPPEVKQ